MENARVPPGDLEVCTELYLTYVHCLIHAIMTLFSYQNRLDWSWVSRGCHMIVTWLLYVVGGPGQDAHLAPTYAAVNALCILGTEEAYKVINRCDFQH